MAEKKMYVVHTQRGYWVGAFIFNEQLRFAKIYTSLHYANETVDRIKRAYPNEDAPKVLEVQLCLAQNMPTADVAPRNEVAKEIFEEIEESLKLSKCYGDSGIYFEIDIDSDIAELKKKYTEKGGNNNA